MSHELAHNERELIVRLAYHPHTGSFLVDFVEKTDEPNGKTLVSLKISEGEAKGISRHTNLKILHY